MLACGPLRVDTSRRSRTTRVSAPFIVLASAALGTACGGKADSDRAAPNPPGTSPARTATQSNQPLPGAGTLACTEPAPASSLPPCLATCVNGQWVPLDVGCIPDPVTACPASPAHVGSSCATYRSGLRCDYAYCAWWVELGNTANCDPVFPIVPVCPERALVSGEGCAYEGQSCSDLACAPGAESRAGHVC